MLQTLPYTLHFLEEIHVPSVLKICDEQLGNGFLSESLLRTHWRSENKFCHVVFFENQVVGFSMMQVSPRQEIAKKMKSESQWFLDYFSEYPQIGYRSLTAVSAAFKGKGVASFLVEKGLEFLSKKVEVVVCDAWKSESTHIGNILERNGYQIIKEIPLFWTAESVHNQYQCSVCGEPPCECMGVIYAKYFNEKKMNWWERNDLKYQNGFLTLGNKNILDFIQNKQTPLYLYNVDRIVQKYENLKAALGAFGVNFNIYYAMKANRHPAILSHLRMRTKAGIDVCSPNELDMALQYGFDEKQITYTGTSLSNRDLSVLLKHKNIKINLDSLSAVRHFIARETAREIGIRINPNIGMAYNQSLEYSGNKVVKFGIYREQWADLKQLIKNSSWVINTVHCHCGSGFLNNQLPRLPYIFEQIDAFLELFPSVKTLNLGGGLGVPQSQGDTVLDLKEWAEIVCTYAKNKGLNLAFEPGDYLVKDAGILVTQVTTVEEKKGKLFVGLDTGMNMNNEYAYYEMNLELVPLLEPDSTSKIKTTIFGNINEPIDLFAEDKLLPPLQEGNFVALLNSGGYGASSSSNHCMRGGFGEYIFFETFLFRRQ